MTFITIEGGPRNAETDPRSGLRWYDWQGRKLLSVTSVRRSVGLPHGLHQWTLSQVIDRAVTRHPELTAMLQRERRPRERVLEKNRIEEARKWLRKGATEERDRAAALGTAVHELAARGTLPDEVPDTVPVQQSGQEAIVPGALIRPRLVQYHDFVTRSGLQVIAAEPQVWNLTVGYAGSADILGRFPDGRIWLLDLKTGDDTYNDYALQLTAYLHAEFVGQDGRVDDGLTAFLHAAAGMAVVHLNEDCWELHVIRDDQETWDAFRHLVSVARWMQAHPTGASVTTGTRHNRRAAAA
ncbi:MAG: hypothetical protein KF809_17240 [Chloroflexi bacterium]|nr:hypothetical protein [Chloroflexota bacterium]